MAKATRKAQPKVFIGSSSEAKPIAEAFAARLASGAIVEKWWQSAAFIPTYSFLASLQFAAMAHDFALFIFAPDDDITSRTVAGKTPRDNVIFEMGLFLGVLGHDRVFGAVVQIPPVASGAPVLPKVKVPSDLSGINFPSVLDPTDPGFAASVDQAADAILDRIEKLSFFHRRLPLVKEYGFEPSLRSFEMALDKTELFKWAESLRGRGFLLVSMVQKKTKFFYEDTDIAVSEIREAPKFADDLHLAATFPATASFRAGEVLIGCLLLLPVELMAKPPKFTRIDDLLEMGCELMARVGEEIK